MYQSSSCLETILLDFRTLKESFQTGQSSSPLDRLLKPSQISPNNIHSLLISSWIWSTIFGSVICWDLRICRKCALFLGDFNFTNIMELFLQWTAVVRWMVGKRPSFGEGLVLIRVSTAFYRRSQEIHNVQVQQMGTWLPSANFIGFLP